MEQLPRFQCQRVECNATFTEDQNPDGSCRYHASRPLFHDGTREWSCCKKRSHDFDLFLEIPGCITGKHTADKPVMTQRPVLRPHGTPSPVQVAATGGTSMAKEICARCKHGFFCADHGTQAKDVNIKPAVPMDVTNVTVLKKVVGMREPQECKNKGCGKTFKLIDNHDSICEFHPGPAVFHDRQKGWQCCDVHVKEFEEFMSIPPCTKGWHNAEPTP